MKCFDLLGNKFELALFVIFVILIGNVNNLKIESKLPINEDEFDLEDIVTEDELDHDEEILINSDFDFDIEDENENDLEDENIIFEEEKLHVNDIQQSDTNYEVDEIKKSYNSILIVLISMIIGFVIASCFLVFALAYNKKTLFEISEASIDIVRSMKDVISVKVENENILAMNI